MNLYLDGIFCNNWLLVRDSYSFLATSVKSFIGAICHTSRCLSGGWGGVLKTFHYRRYNSPHLIMLEEWYTGMVMGSMCALHLTVADVTALITRSEVELQGLFEETGESANQEQYVIHPTKSGVILYNNDVRTKSNNPGFNMGE